MVPFGANESLLIFGGTGQEPITRLTQFDLNSNNMTAKIMFPVQTKVKPEEEDIAGRTGFGGCQYKDSVYYFFGETGYDKNAQLRQCTNEVLKYNFKTNQIERLNTFNAKCKALSDKRHFASCKIGKDFVVFGGYTTEGITNKMVETIIQIDLDTLQWKEV